MRWPPFASASSTRKAAACGAIDCQAPRRPHRQLRTYARGVRRSAGTNHRTRVVLQHRHVDRRLHARRSASARTRAVHLPPRARHGSRALALEPRQERSTSRRAHRGTRRRSGGRARLRSRDATALETIAFLLNLADRSGVPFPGGTLVPLRLRRSDLASLAATTLESVGADRLCGGDALIARGGQPDIVRSPCA